DKNCLSVLLCANSTGSHKFPSLIIGKSLNSRCFKNINKSALPITYCANSKAWMRSDIFIEWLQHLDRGIDREKLKAIDYIATSWNDITSMIIQNCWLKTDILPSTSDDNISDMDSNYTEDIEESNFEALEYIFNNLPEVAEVQEYLQQLDSSIPIEDHLSDEQIMPLVTAKRAADSLETFIKFFEQQHDDSKFNTKDLSIFCKYHYVTKVIEIDSKK
ncbi:4212_t:CDS:2, partial [Rhizophagus irregularis]